MTDVFDLLETMLGFLGVDGDVLSAKALEYSSDVTEELRFGFAVYEYIVDVYLADFVNESIEDLNTRTHTHIINAGHKSELSSLFY